MSKQLDEKEIEPCTSDNCVHKGVCELHESYPDGGNKGGYEVRFLDIERVGLTVMISCDEYKISEG